MHSISCSLTFNNRLYLANLINLEVSLKLDHSQSQVSTTLTPLSSRPNQQTHAHAHPKTTLQRKRRPLPLCDGGWLVIQEGQIASLGLPAICRLARLIPPRGTGLPVSGLPAPSRLPSPKKNLACVPLRHINADIDPHYIGPQFLSERSRSVVADLH